MIEVKVLYSMSAVGTQILLTHKDESVLVDAGDGVLRDLVESKIDFGKIHTILLTHEHFDHFAGLYGMLHFYRLLRRAEPLVIVAPKPVQVVNYLLERPVMYESLPFEISLVEMQDDQKLAIGGMTATAFSIKHTAPNALGYLVEDEGGYRVLVSGDTAVCSNLERRVSGVDMAVLEATYDDSCMELALKHGHMTTSQAHNLAKKAKKAVYIHASPEYYYKKFECSR